MFNEYVDLQVNAFERRQREQQAEIYRITAHLLASQPSIWARVYRSIQAFLARNTATATAHEGPIPAANAPGDSAAAL